LKRVLFLTNYPSPYRVQFFDELGKHMDVTVLFSDRIEAKKHRSGSWFVRSEGHFRVVQLTKRLFTLKGRDLCWDVTKWLTREYDAIVVCGYSTPTILLAMAWMRLKKIPFYMEMDGGLIRQDSRWKLWLKRALVGCADGWISSGRYTTEYLVHYGAKPDKVYTYPFSSLREADLLQSPVSQEEKQQLRRELGIGAKKLILTIGQFIHRKGYDILLKAAAQVNEDAVICFVGGQPTEEYLQLQKELALNNVRFMGFMKKEELVRYYQAADVFVLPTREDIWGLVINEAMAYGLPVITTDRCVAGLELVEDGVNGFIVPVKDVKLLAEKMNELLAADTAAMGAVSLDKVREYTIEGMVRAHKDIFENHPVKNG